ncbi:kelch repeat protein, partial [Ancylostoma caninum]
LAFLGCQAKGCHLSSVERISWNDGQWKCESAPQSNSTEGKSCAAFSSLDESTGVIIGGFNGNDCLKTVDVVRFNSDKMCSTSLADLPFRLKNSVAVSLENGNILLFGGWDESRTMKTVFRLHFNEDHDSYEVTMEAILPYEIEAHGCAVHDGYVYIVGGCDGVSVVDSIIRYSIADRTMRWGLEFNGIIHYFSRILTKGKILVYVRRA